MHAKPGPEWLAKNVFSDPTLSYALIYIYVQVAGSHCRDMLNGGTAVALRTNAEGQVGG